MKQVSQNYKTGSIRLENVNTPALKAGGVMVRSVYSLISAGTEGMKVKEAKLSYVGKARARPDQLKKVLQTVRQQGLWATYRKVVNKLDSLTPLGYSLSGVVVAVGTDVQDFVVGQRVACAGVGYANHAEVNFIPKNLVVPVPDNVSMESAAFTTVGAIAMQGFRQAEMQLGETACVIGLGLLGQILVQILGAAGVKVVGVDISEARCQLAMELGAGAALTPDDPGLRLALQRLTGGAGADCVFITAGGNSNGPTELAAQVARDRARVVDIGKTRLDLPWKDYYEKELDVRFSRSYGPGRYDPNYEERGIDYPIGYVRWTERRNMSSFLDLVAQGRLRLEPIISSIHPFSEAERVYQEMAEGKGGGLGILFQYPNQLNQPVCQSVAIPPTPTKKVSKVGIGVIGAGNYASSMLLPHLAEHPGTVMLEVATTTSLSSANAGRKFRFERTSTDYRGILNAEDIDAVVIATRHASHPRLVAEALATGKAVFVEKPLAIDLVGVEQVRKALVDCSSDRLMVGFNRRFSPLIGELAGVFQNRIGPLTMLYRVHAGQMEHGSWYLDPTEGSRFVGEAGHFFDVFAYLTGARPVSVMAQNLRPENPTSDDMENISVIVTYADGSVGNLLYLTQGGARLPKEFVEVSGEGRTAQLHNFEYVTIYDRDSRREIKKGNLDKGQRAEMQAFVASVRDGSTMPIPIDSLIDSTLVTLAAAESCRTGRCVNLADYWVSER